MVLGSTVKKSHLKFPQLHKTLSLFLSCIFYCRTNQKNVLQKEIKHWTLEVYLYTGEPGSWFLLIESLKMTCTRSYTSFLNFLWNKGFECFLQPNVLPKFSKITDLPTFSKNRWIELILTYPKLAKWLSILKCLKSAWKSKYLQSWRS